ncbi:MAG: transcription termination factor NusA [Candidatus Liptonbacteria bacterium RIFCSPLOWO2_01_FULL_56_20]|uniref:Transcription termination/antitermination protein NusA n=1 Tax=Candidatus Liptonbacteria bacterium RIFCSPLOWO2_01_FULL_56_20 TaxID=1798652 RepID=A0A1G2CHG4_9BACT|nr:MAG: NusA antitermination factor [Parcubacteria group bacterium GW2011_GWB1_56_8]OGY97518.1 MAG: transcription termination factor NusA [Candidatus Liptonbacteria bacterium RIFCSPHIGHO2_01_FULL_56_18b]OGZ00667.1 MAG: transcription termination factor NusA [Candidatus Liptonbacteria bacterium RIFCSPLOWO2_01_FULL_56_20]
MINVKDLAKAIKQVADEKGLAPETVVDAIQSSIAAAYKKEYGQRGEIVRAELDLKTGLLRFWRVKTVVDETTVRLDEKEEGEEEAEEKKNKTKELKKSTELDDEPRLPRYNPDRHILFEEAKAVKPDSVLGEELVFPLESREEFGRIAAQAAKQAIFQKLRESERDSILKEWRGKESQVASGVVQRFERGHVYIDLGRAIGVMFANESIPGEHYRTGERLRFLVLAVQEDTRLPGIILSRSHPKFVSKLFELEVPEVAEGTVEIKLIAREPGSRTKLAVTSHADGVDPVGALVGQRGTRVMAVNNELGQEKIDIIEWSEDPEKFIANSLSPAKVKSVEALPRREARVYVPEDQLSLAIGRGGQNVRLAAKLTGWKIDVRSQTRPEEVQEGGVAGLPEGEAGGKESFDEE